VYRYLIAFIIMLAAYALPARSAPSIDNNPVDQRTASVQISETCKPDYALQSMREILRWQGNNYDIVQCTQAMEHSILLLSGCLLLLLCSLGLHRMANAYPTQTDDNTIAHIAQATRHLTIIPFGAAIVCYLGLTLLVRSVMDFDRFASLEPYSATSQTAAAFFYFAPIGPGLFLLLLLASVILSLMAFYKMSVIQAHLGHATSTTTKLIAILPPCLSSCASITTLIKAGLLTL
jgi:hypothetical protein